MDQGREAETTAMGNEMISGLTEYASPSKQTWRGWVWNRIAERLTENVRGPSARRRSLRDRTAIYLVGPNDHERPIAIRHGFQNHNVIAIDANPANIMAVRRSGGFGVCGRLEEILIAWPRDWPIDAIIADTCTGFSNNAVTLLWNVFASGGIRPHTVVALNLQRGRDPETNEWRRRANERTSIGKHRALSLLYLFEATLAHEVEKLGVDRLTACELVERTQRPVFNEYRNSRQSVYMDSVVFRWGLTAPELDLHSINELLRCFRLKGAPFKPHKPERIKATRRKLAALRAMRTKAIG